MKRFLYGTLFLIACSFAFANDEPVPGGTLLTRLPEGSRLVVKSKLSVYEQRKRDDPGFKVIYGKFTLLTLNIDDNTSRTLEAGKTLPIVKTTTSIGEVGTALPIALTATPTNHKNFLVIVWNDSISLHGTVWLDERDGELPRTVAEFHKWVGGYLQIIYDDPNYNPYPGMDKGMVVDILTNKITAALKANKYAEALPHFVLLEKQGAPLPESFYYYYTESLDKAGKKAQARVHAEDYLKRYGKQGRYYAQVIEIMGRQ